MLRNILKIEQYAKGVTCPVYIIGSDSDRTLNRKLQEKVADCFINVNLRIFEKETHENYLITPEVVEYITIQLLCELTNKFY